MPEKPPEPGPRLERRRQHSFPSAVLSLDVIEGGAGCVVACLDGQVYRMDSEGKTTPLGRHESYASGVVCLAGGRVAVSAGYDGRLLWHDLGSGTVIRSVTAHSFWSWDLAASRDGRWLASVTGRYEVGGYRYEPAAETELSVRLYDAASGELRHSWAHVPPVQAVAISPDGAHVAAGNLMGEIRVWETDQGREVARVSSGDLTSWGVIKSHHYLGGVFALEFGPDGRDLYACGMGPMLDPMAGNGVQRWLRFDWRAGRQTSQTAEGESGQGLMEALAFHPEGRLFAMAGRLFQGSWNLALFDVASGKKVFAMDAKHRITDAVWMRDGRHLMVAKARQQEKRKDGKWPEFGFVEVYERIG
jgi:WD40 repeat protein